MTVWTRGDTQTLEQQFNEFDTAHPEVYHELVRLAREMKARGYERCGIATIYEVCRWRSMIRPGAEQFKLNNNHRAFYARKIMANCPDLVGMFSTRAQGIPSHVA